ncbi:MAG TPA: isoamylase early set domain-containing protein [Gemmatimonadaceae bacterium]|jgi:hypothetical protein|nr:isoamylase early set domain-containing protein [Gemmatimonadaceae bacterium]
MTDDRDDRLFQRAAAALREPRSRDQDALDELLDALRGEVTARVDPDRGLDSRRAVVPLRPRLRSRLTRGAVRFIAGLAAGIAFAAGLGIGIFAGWRMRGASYRIAVEDRGVRPTLPPVGSTAAAASGSSMRPVQFMLVAPTASRVALVGEFNDWDPAATPMARAAGGAWHVALPLARGRHVYAFVVDGTAWVPDPQAPLAPEGWFGSRNSVMLVDRGQTP